MEQVPAGGQVCYDGGSGTSCFINVIIFILSAVALSASSCIMICLVGSEMCIRDNEIGH